MSKTVFIESPGQFTQLLSSSRVVVADFFADWCGPCKAIAPFYEQLSSQLSRQNQITFTKINTDMQLTLAQSYNITAMPTFIIFKNGRETQRIRGADTKGLGTAVQSLANEASTADASGSSSSGGRWSGAALPRGYSDVTDSVDLQGLDFLNVSSEAGPAKSIFDASKPKALGDDRDEAKDYIESDTDEQLMMFIPFQSTLKAHTLHITSRPAPDDEEVMRPRTIKVFVNRAHVLGFDEADSIEATQVFALEENSWDAETATAKLELRFVKFQNITSLVVFVVDGEGEGERTRIDRVRIVGETGEKRAMGKLEKIGDEQGE